MKKLDKLSIEDLLNALESPEIENEALPLPDDTPPVMEFIERFKLESGKHLVQSNLVFDLYLQYYPRTINQLVFSQMASKILKYDRKHCQFKLKQTAGYLNSLLINSKRTDYSKLKTEGYRRHFAAFFKNLNIESGQHRIPWYALYHLYRCYCVDHKIKKPRNKLIFLKFISMYFEKLTSNDGSIFLVDTNTANAIPKEDYDRLKDLYQEENKKGWLQTSRTRSSSKSKKQTGRHRRRK